MAHEPTREQSAIQHALATGSDKVAAAFLAANPRKMSKFTGLHGPHFERLVNYLQSSDPAAIDKARSRLDDSLDDITRIPTRGLTLTKGVKHHVVRAQRKDEADILAASWKKYGSVSAFLRAPLSAPIKLLAESYAWLGAAMGLDKAQRAHLLTTASTPIFVAAGLMFTPNLMDEANAAINPHKAGHSDTLSNDRNLSARMGPLEISVTRGVAANAFETVIKKGVHNDERLTPELAQLLKRSPRARELVAMIRTEAAARNLDGDLGANQLFKETSFIEKFISGEEASPAGALGFAQIMPETGAEYGYSIADLKNPKIAIQAWGRIMERLTKNYGDQRLAAIAYNGGGGAIDFAKEKLGLDKITLAQWVGFMVDRRATLGTKIPSAWHVETLEYVMTISPEHRPLLAKIKENEAREALEAREAKLGASPLPNFVPVPAVRS